VELLEPSLDVIANKYVLKLMIIYKKDEENGNLVFVYILRHYSFVDVTCTLPKKCTHTLPAIFADTYPSILLFSIL